MISPASKRIGVAIFGGGGFGAGELLRLLYSHPEVKVTSVISESAAGKNICEVHTHLSGCYDLKFSSVVPLELFDQFQEKVAFLALPPEISARISREVLRDSRYSEWKIIDLSGAHRIGDHEQHSLAYPEVAFETSIRERFVYALPEDRESQTKNLQCVANPGCLASASILALLPLRPYLEGANIVIDAKTGSSGAGRELKTTTQHANRHSNFYGYKPFVHQHEPEIKQALKISGDISFLAQSVPLVRGIFVSAHLTLSRKVDESALRASYQDYFSTAPFVRLRSDSPQVADVLGTNFCDIAVFSRGARVLVLAAIDNLGKGMAGTAIQNMNLACGLPETTGLMQPGLRPL